MITLLLLQIRVSYQVYCIDSDNNNDKNNNNNENNNNNTVNNYMLDVFILGEIGIFVKFIVEIEVKDEVLFGVFGHDCGVLLKQGVQVRVVLLLAEHVRIAARV